MRVLQGDDLGIAEAENLIDLQAEVLRRETLQVLSGQPKESPGWMQPATVGGMQGSPKLFLQMHKRPR